MTSKGEREKLAAILAARAERVGTHVARDLPGILHKFYLGCLMEGFTPKQSLDLTSGYMMAILAKAK